MEKRTILDKIKEEYCFLIVDDKDLVLNLLKDILRSCGFKNIYLARSAKEALAKLKKTQINFVISDYHMPNMTGIELLTKIRENPKYYIPVVIITGEMSKDKVIYAIEEGADGYQQKPFTAKNIIGIIEENLAIALNPDLIKNKIRQLSRLKLKKKYDEALAFAQDILKKEEHPAAYFISAECYYHKKDYENAQKNIHKCLEKGENSKALHLLGEIYMEQGKHEEAIECHKRASKVNPLNLKRKIDLGKVYLKLGLVNEAVETFDSIRELNPTDLNFVDMGDAYLKSGDLKKAGIYLQQAADPIPETISIFNKYAIELRKAGYLEGSLKQYHRCLQIEPDNYVILYNLGRLYLEMGKYEEAKKALESVLRLVPDNKNAKKLLDHTQFFLLGGEHLRLA
jgi:two-component system chemotaxis response regulator CheY